MINANKPEYFKSLRAIKEFDRIEIETPMNELYSELDKFNPVLRKEDNIEYRSLLDEYVIKFRTPFSNRGKKFDIVTFAYINEVEGIMEAYTYETSTGIYYLMFRTEQGRKDPFVYRIEKATEKECHIALAQILSLVGYIQDRMRHTDTVVKSERKPRVSSSHTNSSKPVAPKKRTVRVINNDKVVYSVYSYKDNIAHTIRHYQRHTTSWSVIGHQRHYKSGKTIWVNPYTKGEGKPEPKTYVIK